MVEIASRKSHCVNQPNYINVSNAIALFEKQRSQVTWWSHDRSLLWRAYTIQGIICTCKVTDNTGSQQPACIIGYMVIQPLKRTMIFFFLLPSYAVAIYSN